MVEGLLRIERRVDVAELDLADVLLDQLWNAGQRFEHITTLTVDEQIISRRL
ncbi:hypothetical protein ES5_01366 [Dietzia cinnamea P4]|nr:hypothetical protein ES5_01366 [Dietzia cinnamea P4]